MFNELSYLSIFLSSFLAATFFPIPSELTFLTFLRSEQSPSIIILLASIGNTLGGLFTFYIGWLGKLEWAEKYLKISHKKIIKLKAKTERHGQYLAFFTFLPLIGDPIALALGFFKFSWVKTIIYMTIGKTLRYIIIAICFSEFFL